MPVDLTHEQLLHFAGRLLWVAAFGGVLGSLAFGLLVRLLCWCIAGIGNAFARRNRIYVARIRAKARERVSNG
jgi:hypothetical protein